MWRGIEKLQYQIGLLAACLKLLAVAQAADWPMYGHDPHRSNTTEEHLTTPCRLAWTSICAQQPRPAWPEPVKVVNRLDFDYAPHPVVGAGMVCFGSSADDAIRALDLATGKERWHFITGGPIRFAPHISENRVFLASDDGFIYCLDAVTGALRWKFRAAPRDERLIGNERMISRWPVRTGVLVMDGVVYGTAGMWSNEGIFVYALDAGNGQVLWCNDTSGIVGEVRTLHVESSTDPTASDFSTFGVCPQGALLATSDLLMVPTGKGLPAIYDRRTGKLISYRLEAAKNQSGGSWVTLHGTDFFTYNPHPPYYLNFFNLFDGKRGQFRTIKGPGLASLIAARGDRFLPPFKTSTIVTEGKIIVEAAFGLVLAGDKLWVGEDGAVSAYTLETKEKIWGTPVNGQARGLAVAGGRLIVSTDRGQLYCFEPERGAPTTPGEHKPAASLGSPEPPPGAVVEELRAAGIDRGYALVLGDADGTVATALASHTRLHVIPVLTDETAVAALRENLLAKTNLYGSRIHVQLVDRLDQLPFTSYFANAIVVTRPVAGLSGKELYRVLRPCGGMLWLPGLAQAEIDALLQESGAGQSEIVPAGGSPRVRRGRLPGASDWDIAGEDPLVKWPLRLLWFGGPGPALVLDRKQGNHIGPVANGRYFVLGDQELSAVDAYNGTILWSRPVPKLFLLLRFTDEKVPLANAEGVIRKGFVRSLRADADHVFLTLALYSRGDENEKTCIQMNARTGEQETIYGPYTPPPQVSLKTPVTWRLEADANLCGAVTLQTSPTGLLLELNTRDTTVTPFDRWDLFFDFRLVEERYGLYERGTFQVKVFPAKEGAPAAWSPGTTPNHVLESGRMPQIDVRGAHDAEGTATTVFLPWNEIQTLVGSRPTSFGFAVTLSSHTGGDKEPVVQRYLFSDRFADSWNNGWANVVLDEGRAEDSPGADTALRPRIIAGPISALPKPPPRATPLPPSSALSSRMTPRLHPLTGEREAKFFQSGSFGCGAILKSADCLFTRSTALAIYDFADDSGTRHFDGTKPSCGASIVASNGLLLSSEGRGGCECTTNFQTSLALAPTDQRSNEDWAIFYDREVDTQVRQAAFNFGAPGDRRAVDGTLWLGFPRPGGKTIGVPLVPDGTIAPGVFRQFVPPLKIPLEWEAFEGFGPYRVNADRVRIESTDIPWIYASGYKGMRKITLNLNFEKNLVSQPLVVPPELDGSLAEPGWSGEPQSVLPFTQTKVFLQHDADHLYVAARRAALIDPKGKVAAWPSSTADETDSFFKSDSWELFLSDTAGKQVIHLALNMAGSRFDALAGHGNAAMEDRKWTADWKSAVRAGEEEWALEMAIPWKTLAAAGLDKDRLVVNFQTNTTLPLGYGLRFEALRYPGPGGRNRCEYFVRLGLGEPPPARGPRPFTVHLHFAELENLKPGERVFDVKLQGQTVLERFDVVAAAGGICRAVVKEFQHISADEALILEFLPSTQPLTPRSAPILSAWRVFDETAP